MSIDMYICAEDLKKMIKAYYKEFDQDIFDASVTNVLGETEFKFRKFEKIKGISIITETILNLDDIKDILSTIIYKYEVLNVRANIDDDDKVAGLYVDVREKSSKLVLGVSK